MKSIVLRTEVPGPRSRELAARAAEVVARPVVPGGEVFIARGEGAVVEDVDGNRLLDFIGGVGCLITGHSHPKVVEAIRSHSARFLHTDFSVVPYPGYLDLAERLSERCGGGRKVAFFNSGAEAVENAVKIARGATGRPGIVCFEGAFHGRTYMALTLTYREAPHKRGFGPFVPEVHRAPFPNFSGATLGDTKGVLDLAFAEHQIAGVIVEPVLGEGGFVVPPAELLPLVASVCRDHEAVFIVDEVQSGYGRTGTFLASDQSGVRPDIVLLGKSIASGLPLSAVVGDPAWMDALEPNALGGTYVGNPVACAAGLAVLDILDEERLIERAKLVGDFLKAEWKAMAGAHPQITSVRGQGAMVGVEFDDPKTTKRFLEEARRRGVLAITAGPRGEVIRHLMPLVMTDEQLAEGTEVFREAIAAF